MFDTSLVRSDHRDVINDVAYDYYGKRMATCSNDQTVKIWDQDETGKWNFCSSWKAHSGSIYRLCWAHPEFGQVIATCSFDRTASVWEEIIGEKVTAAMAPTKRWARRTTLVDSRTSVKDVKFAPKHLGLLLATASEDGMIRIYEAPDIMNLAQWSVQHEISCKLALSCLSWNNSMYRLHSPMIAAGSNDTSPSGGKVFIFEYSDNARKWTKIEIVSSIVDSVHDVSFAPSNGRSYHMLAVASKDVHILNLKPSQEPTGNPRLEIQCMGQFNEHHSTVWRVSWNITGTILASTGDDLCVRIWKMNFNRNWTCAAVLTPEAVQTPIEIMAQLTSPSASIAMSSNNTATSKEQRNTYYSKRGTIRNPNEIINH